jgi:hypothetical protein
MSILIMTAVLVWIIIYVIRRRKTPQEHKPSVFRFQSDGFIYLPKNITVKWSEIIELSAYKVDLMGYDEIRLDIKYGNDVIVISEDTPGWNDFLEKMNAVFPGIPVDWAFTIAQPAFATNLTILYRR